MAAILGLFGCASRDCKPSAELVRARGATESRAIATSLGLVARSTEGNLDVLVLSGGGSHGAFGAGVLRGWRQAVWTRPKFQVVTGVSTGALLATHAFLGDTADDAVLEHIYTTVTDGDVFAKRWFFMLPFSDSLSSLAPLKRLIARYITDHLIDCVGREAAARRLYVATTNMDEGRLKVWDLTALAEQKEYGKYRAVLLASSAVPGIYSPVDIDGALHCDGGVREQLFIRKVMLELTRARQTRASAHASTTVTVHVILNGQIDVPPACVAPNLLPVALRGVEILAAASAVGNLLQSKATADAGGASWRLARIPPSVDVPFDAQTFSPGPMRELYEEGVRFGRSGTWETSVPQIEDATRVLER